MLTIININNNADNIRVYDHRTQYNKNDLLYAAERVKNAKHANINRRGGRISLQHKINCNGVIKHNTPRQLKHKLFIERCIDTYGDGFTFNILDDEYYNNIIVIGSRDFCEINNSEYGELYDAIKKRADDMSGEIMDINDGVNDYYETISEAVADMLYVENIAGEQAAAVKNAAVNYWNNKINFDEYAAALLTALTPHKWNCCMLRGYCQGDWINILYPADVYSDEDINFYEAFYFGKYQDYIIKYRGETICDYIPDHIAWNENELTARILELTRDYLTSDENISAADIVYNFDI